MPISQSEFRSLAMTLSKRDLLIASDWLMTLAHDAARRQDFTSEERLNARSLELWLLATA